jgi:leader peptidase (prepilin peptidase) / N-methyltransferase
MEQRPTRAISSIHPDRKHPDRNHPDRTHPDRNRQIAAPRPSPPRSSKLPLDTPEPTQLVSRVSLGSEVLLGGGAMADTSLCTVENVGAEPPAAPGTRPTYRTAVTRSTQALLVAAMGVAMVCVIAVATQQVPIAAAVGVVALIPPALVDVQVRRLPNRMVLVAALALIITLAIECAVGSVADPASATSDAALGAALLTAPLLAMHLVSPSSMGFGDVKAAVVLGAAIGLVHPQLALVSLLVASASTAVVGLAGRRRHLPFGPGLVAGAALTLALSGWPALRFDTTPPSPSTNLEITGLGESKADT